MRSRTGEGRSPAGPALDVCPGRSSRRADRFGLPRTSTNETTIETAEDQVTGVIWVAASGSSVPRHVRRAVDVDRVGNYL
jgi:hypothetical protein